MCTSLAVALGTAVGLGILGKAGTGKPHDRQDLLPIGSL